MDHRHDACRGDGGTKAEPLPQFPRNPSVLPGWDRVPSCAVWWPGVTLLTTRADAVYSTNSSLLLLLWFVIPHNAATQPELIILTKYTDSGDSHRHQPPSRAQHSLYADVDWTCTMCTLSSLVNNAAMLGEATRRGGLKFSIPSN